MRTKRSIQINVCVSPAEMRRAKLRAKRETEGNVSALVRKMLFAESNAQGGAGISVQSISAEIGELAGMIAAQPAQVSLSSEQLQHLREAVSAGELNAIVSDVEKYGEYNPAHYHSMYCPAREGQACNCGAFESNERVYEGDATQTIADEVQEVHCE